MSTECLFKRSGRFHCRAGPPPRAPSPMLPRNLGSSAETHTRALTGRKTAPSAVPPRLRSRLVATFVLCCLLLRPAWPRGGPATILPLIRLLTRSPKMAVQDRLTRHESRALSRLLPRESQGRALRSRDCSLSPASLSVTTNKESSIQTHDSKGGRRI